MTELVAFLSTGKGSWAQVAKLIQSENWERVFLLTNTFGKEKYTPNQKTELIVIDLNLEPNQMRDRIYAELKERVKGLEVAVNMCSGQGKEHMALIGAVLRLGVGIRVVDICDGKVEVI